MSQTPPTVRIVDAMRVTHILTFCDAAQSIFSESEEMEELADTVLENYVEDGKRRVLFCVYDPKRTDIVMEVDEHPVDEEVITATIRRWREEAGVTSSLSVDSECAPLHDIDIALPAAIIVFLKSMAEDKHDAADRVMSRRIISHFIQETIAVGAILVTTVSEPHNMHLDFQYYTLLPTVEIH